MKKTVSPIVMFLVSIVALAIMAITLNEISKNIVDPEKKLTKENYAFVFWFFRVITALAASAISISIPGMLKVEYTPNGQSIKELNQGDDDYFMTMAESKPAIVAGGAIAVFVLVYLFNPINSIN